MAKQSGKQKEIVGRVMHEFKHHDLTRGQGGEVTDPRQAIAIALSEAGASNRQSPAENRRKLRRTVAKEKRAGMTRKDLYEQAQKAGIPGRSRMSKDELRQALART